MQWGYILVSLPKNSMYSQQRAYVAEKTRKKLSLIVSDSPRSRKVHGKEHTQSGKVTVRD